MAFFAKKEEEGKKPDEKAEDLPEELPSLAEEVVETKEGEPAPADSTAPAEAPTDAETPTDAPQQPSDEIPEELPDIAQPEGTPAEAPAEETASTASNPAEPPLVEGYLSKIEEKLQKGTSAADMLKGMKAHWEEKIEKEDSNMPSLLDLDNKIKTKISEITNLENEWVKSKKDFERLKVLLSNIEGEIEIRTQGLQELKKEQDKLRKIQEGKRAHHNKDKHSRDTKGGSHYSFEKAFELESGRKIYSIKELANKVALMKDDEYKKYIHPENHFANWIRHVFNNDDLADEVEHVKTRNQLALLLAKNTK